MHSSARSSAQTSCESSNSLFVIVIVGICQTKGLGDKCDRSAAVGGRWVERGIRFIPSSYPYD